MPKLKKHKTPFPGVRFYNHRTRKHGVKFDRYFSIRYQRDGKRVEEGIGWASEGWTAEKAALTLAELKNAARTGQGPTRLAERRQTAKAKALKEKTDALPFSTVFTDRYFPQANADKSTRSCARERSLFKKWINPVLGPLSLKDVAPIHLERIKANMRKAGLADRTIEYCLAVVRQVFNYAYRNNLFTGDNPTKKVKIPHPNNRRTRFLSPAEAELLLRKIRTRSAELYEICLISLHCGLRASEIFNLTWVDVDLGNGLLSIKDAKGGKSRFGYMTEPVKQIFLAKVPGKATDRLFPARNGRLRDQVSKAFNRAVKDLGLNDGITDRRDRVVFHTLRHTYASWLVQAGESIYTVKERLGHSTLAMTERYSHLAPENQQRTVKTLEGFIARKDEKEAEKLF